MKTTAVVLCSLVIALPLLVGRLVEAILDSLNPADVDPTQGLAYLSQILGFGFGSLALLLVAILVVLVLLGRRDGRPALRLPLIVLGVQLLVGVATLALAGIISAAGDAYAG